MGNKPLHRPSNCLTASGTKCNCFQPQIHLTCPASQATICSCDAPPSVQAILEEEEELISAHRAQIERNMSLVRDEMNLLGEVCLKQAMCARMCLSLP